MYKFDSADFFISSLVKPEIWSIAFYNEYVKMVKAAHARYCRVKSVEGVSPGHDYSTDKPMPPLTGEFCFLHRVPLDSQGICSGAIRELRSRQDAKALETLDMVVDIRDIVLKKLHSWGLSETILDGITREQAEAVK